MAKIALKVDVDTLRGTCDGVPRLMKAFERQGVRATFLFSLGPDHTGWALRRVFRPGFLSKVSRTSVLSHYGLRTLMYGVLLPAPDIGLRAQDDLRAVAKAGHECGIHCWDHVVWQDNVRVRDERWTRLQMQRAFDRYVDVFGAAPVTHGAAGWQMNAAAFRQIDDWGMPYASDGRGVSPHALSLDGHRCTHVQLPTTLPTMDELIGVADVTEANVVSTLLAKTRSDRNQVFTLHAELEGGLLSNRFEELLNGWRAQGHELTSLGGLYRSLDLHRLPVLPMQWGRVEGRSGELMVEAAA